MKQQDRNIWMKHIEKNGIIGEKDCPFCKRDEYLLQEFHFWNVLKNKYPYKNLEKHILLVPKRHIDHAKYLLPEELAEIPEIEKYIERYFSGEDYFSFTRHTNEGKSIEHIHYHYLPGKLYSDKLESIL